MNRSRFQHCGPAVDLLGFLESLGFRFELADGDTVDVRIPPLLRCIASHVERVLPAIRIQLEARGCHRCQPSRKNGEPPTKPPRGALRQTLGEPLLMHWDRAQWDAYVLLGEVNAVWAGSARSERAARALARKKFTEAETLSRRKNDAGSQQKEE